MTPAEFARLNAAICNLRAALIRSILRPPVPAVSNPPGHHHRSNQRAPWSDKQVTAALNAFVDFDRAHARLTSRLKPVNKYFSLRIINVDASRLYTSKHLNLTPCSLNHGERLLLREGVPPLQNISPILRRHLALNQPHGLTVRVPRATPTVCLSAANLAELQGAREGPDDSAMVIDKTAFPALGAGQGPRCVPSANSFVRFAQHDFGERARGRHSGCLSWLVGVKILPYADDNERRACDESEHGAKGEHLGTPERVDEDCDRGEDDEAGESDFEGGHSGGLGGGLNWPHCLAGPKFNWHRSTGGFFDGKSEVHGHASTLAVYCFLCVDTVEAVTFAESKKAYPLGCEPLSQCARPVRGDAFFSHGSEP